MRLSVLTPAKPFVEAEVAEVYCPGSVGCLGVLPDHITFLASLGTGEITYKTESGSASLVISGGIIEVVDNEVTILADRAVAPGDVDVSAARQELAQAEEALGSLDAMSDEYAAARSNREWALARVAAAEK
jgi:F-type H+-transporting ATPase subunit epsilon